MKRRLELFSAGSNAKGQLGNGSNDDTNVFRPCVVQSSTQTSPAPVKPNLNLSLPPNTQRVASISTSGANHTLLLLLIQGAPAPQVYASGDSSRNQLPIPTSSSTTFRRVHFDLENAGYHVVHIAAAWETSYFVLRHVGIPTAPDILISIGANDLGQLGIGTTSSSPTTKQNIVNLSHLFPSKAVFRITQITVSIHHVVLVMESQGQQLVAGWGAYRHGQLGRRQTTSFTPSPTHLVLPHPSPVQSVACGVQHTLLLHEDGLVTAWGSNRKNQLAELGEASGIDNVICTWNGSYLVSSASQGTWTISATGSGNKGQLGRLEMVSSEASSSYSIEEREQSKSVPTPGLLPVAFPTAPEVQSKRVRKLAAGSEHLLLLLEDSHALTELWVWGWNEHGNLGLGHLNDVFVPQRVVLSDAIGSGRVVDVWAGCGTSWLVVEYMDT